MERILRQVKGVCFAGICFAAFLTHGALAVATPHENLKEGTKRECSKDQKREAFVLNCFLENESYVFASAAFPLYSLDDEVDFEIQDVGRGIYGLVKKAEKDTTFRFSVSAQACSDAEATSLQWFDSVEKVSGFVKFRCGAEVYALYCYQGC